jgi:hypothetical protein
MVGVLPTLWGILGTKYALPLVWSFLAAWIDSGFRFARCLGWMGMAGIKVIVYKYILETGRRKPQRLGCSSIYALNAGNLPRIPGHPVCSVPTHHRRQIAEACLNLEETHDPCSKVWHAPLEQFSFCGEEGFGKHQKKKKKKTSGEWVSD